MRDSRSTRSGVLSHNKIVLVRGRRTSARQPHAWAYIGSANFSESAWGKVLKESERAYVKIEPRNWECGVLFPVPKEQFEGLELEQGTVPPIDVFKGIMDVPWEIPGETYDEKEPWYFLEVPQDH
jgi:hypothetical protein